MNNKKKFHYNLCNSKTLRGHYPSEIKLNDIYLWCCSVIWYFGNKGDNFLLLFAALACKQSGRILGTNPRALTYIQHARVYSQWCVCVCDASPRVQAEYKLRLMNYTDWYKSEVRQIADDRSTCDTHVRIIISSSNRMACPAGILQVIPLSVCPT